MTKGNLTVVFALSAAFGQAAPPQVSTATYVGSTTYKTCHPALYERWSKTRMANVVVDPKVHPDVILPDLDKADPLLTFKKEDIAMVYGSKWKQRYFQRVGDDYFPLNAQWDVSHQIWRAYNAAPIGGRSLSSGELRSSNRAALRWLPFGELQHSDQDGH